MRTRLVCTPALLACIFLFGCTTIVEARYACSSRAAKLAGENGAIDRAIYVHVFETCMEANGFPEKAPID